MRPENVVGGRQEEGVGRLNGDLWVESDSFVLCLPVKKRRKMVQTIGGIE